MISLVLQASTWLPPPQPRRPRRALRPRDQNRTIRTGLCNYRLECAFKIVEGSFN